VPDIYDAFPEQAFGNVDLLRRVLNAIDHDRLHKLVCDVTSGRLKMLKPATVPRIVQASLEWDNWDQTCLWQLVTAHSVSIATIGNCLPLLPARGGGTVAATCLLAQLRYHEPTQDVVARVLATTYASSGSSKKDDRQDDDDDEDDLMKRFVSAALCIWSDNHLSKAATHLSALLSTLAQQSPSGASPAKRKRGGASAASKPTFEQILIHLDYLRETQEKSLILFHDEVMQGLHQAEPLWTDKLKNSYSELYEIVKQHAIKTSRSAQKTGRGTNSRKAAVNSRSKTSNAKSKKNASETEDDSEDEIVPTKSKRRRQVESDSD
jgi:integrator complex subunit 3